MRLLLGLVLLLTACADGKGAPPGVPPLPPSPEAPAGSVESPAALPVPVILDFAAYGDARHNHDVHRRICASIVRSGAKFVTVSGDLVNFGEDEDDWKEFRDVTRELRAKTPYYPAMGNHDTSFDRAFEKEFKLDRAYYDRRAGDIHLFLLDSNSYFSDAEQLRWLEETAAASDARHKFAVFHHPPFTIDPWGDGESRPVRERLHPSLVRLKFCAAFVGHHHVFYTTVRDGLRYVVTAGGGAPLYDLDPSKAQKGDLFRKFHHFVGGRIGEQGISAHVFDPDGREVPELAFPLCRH